MHQTQYPTLVDKIGEFCQGQATKSFHGDLDLTRDRGHDGAKEIFT